MSDPLTVHQAQDIANVIRYRQGQFSDEPVETSIIVALLNYGDQCVEVVCTNNEWTGTKGDLPMGEGLPHCPNGHPLFETSAGKQLAVVDRVLVEGNEDG